MPKNIELQRGDIIKACCYGGALSVSGLLAILCVALDRRGIIYETIFGLGGILGGGILGYFAGRKIEDIYNKKFGA